MIIETIQELNRNKDVIATLLKDVPKEVVLWKENINDWCLLEIICHLYDEERLDFRARCNQILSNPEEEMSSINPPSWVTEHKYIDQDYEKMIEDWLNERTLSIDWLIGLENPDWSRTYQHPKLGPMSAGFMLSNWLAHDYLHIRQILKVKFNYLEHQKEQALFYAGEW